MVREWLGRVAGPRRSLRKDWVFSNGGQCKWGAEAEGRLRGAGGGLRQQGGIIGTSSLLLHTPTYSSWDLGCRTQSPPFHRRGNWGLEKASPAPRAWSWPPRAATWSRRQRPGGSPLRPALPRSPISTWPGASTFRPGFPHSHQHLTTASARPRGRMHTPGAKFLMLPSCAEAGGALAWATGAP